MSFSVVSPFIMRNAQFWSGSPRKVASFVTHVSARAFPEADCSIPPTIQVWTHSYNSEIAGVVEMSSVIGGCNFLTSRGS